MLSYIKHIFCHYFLFQGSPRRSRLHKKQQTQGHDRHTAHEPVYGQVVLAVLSGRWQQFIERDEYHDARHHCYAYMIGADRLTWRVNDDGEPSGSAGKPILGQINSAGITNVLIVVVRYFGGTLLGVSGLINAYRTAAAEAIKNSGIISVTLMNYYRLVFPYTAMNDVMKILKEENAGQSDQSFDLECRITIRIPLSESERITGRLSAVEGTGAEWLYTR